ncbi:MAG: hypothetical protein KJZ83_22550 [Burkholderiaceae bacterium]|nr:hypothetical protein [Burkholderiaceae bacterium]
MNDLPRRELLLAALGSQVPGAHRFAHASGGDGAARLLRVGPTREHAVPSQAARAARSGDTIEIDSGDYIGDTAVWGQARLTIRGVGGAVRLFADGQAAEGKAIWVVRQGRFDIEGLEFHGARVPNRNGAGIRFEGGHLRVRRCRFIDNENGILTGNDGVSELELERCEFAGQTPTGEGFTHNLYVGRIARFEMRACWSHHANAGHLVKTRARQSYLYCNRLADETAGRASYELDCPNGGLVVALGNLFAQEPGNRNHTLLSFGAEGYHWSLNQLVLGHNTFANRGPIAVFVHDYPGSAAAIVENNLFAGEGLVEGIRLEAARGNLFAARADFADTENFDYRLRERSVLRGRAVKASHWGAFSLEPRDEYLHPLELRALAATTRRSPGAFQS